MYQDQVHCPAMQWHSGSLEVLGVDQRLWHRTLECVQACVQECFVCVQWHLCSVESVSDALSAGLVRVKDSNLLH